MPIPLAYGPYTRGDFASPRAPPMPQRYQPPTFEKFDLVNNGTRGHEVYWMTDNVRHHIVAMLGEFVGTFSFLFFALVAVQTANGKPDTLPRTDVLNGPPSLLQILYISVGFGLSLTVNVWVFYRVSGGMFNPAVTVGLCLVGAFNWTRAILLIPVQVLGGIAASAVITILIPGALNVGTTLGTETTVAQGLFIEMILTALLVFTILMLAVEKHRASFIAPVGIGMALAAGHIIGINYTGAGINPARSFGPPVVHGDFTSYHWIYWLGPLLGALSAVLLYKFVKFLHYESANAGQDDDGLDTYRLVSHIHPVHRLYGRRSTDSITSMSRLTQQV